MTFRVPGLALLSLSLVLVVAPCSASAKTLHTEYSVSVRGFPVGRAKLQAEIADGHYRIEFSGGIRGLARLFSDAETSASSVGAVGDDRLLPREYTHRWFEDDETEAVDMHFEDRRLTEIVLDPPRTKPERYVPITAKDKVNVLDPISTFVWPAAGDLTPDICNRTLAVMDGKRRFDLALSFSRIENFSTRDKSFSERAAVCKLRYEPISGHRISGKDRTIFEGGEMEVWMTRAGDGLLTPARIQLRTRIGRVVFLATTIRTE
jgi:hypothetical protein